jgi:hypothetical protein
MQYLGGPGLQVKKLVNRFWERLWHFKSNLEDGIERSLEAVGLIESPVSQCSLSARGSCGVSEIP